MSLTALVLAAALTTHTAADRTTLTLSDTLAVTLSLDGPAPLRVEPPRDWLTDESAAVWKILGAEPPRIEPRPGGRERWSITLRIDPFLPGTLPLQFATAQATAGGDTNPQPVTWDGLELSVTTSLDPKTAAPRPITGVEPVPPGGETAVTELGYSRLADAFGVVGVAGLMLIVARRLRLRAPESPTLRALRELDRLRNAPDSVNVLDRVVSIGRQFLEQSASIPATHWTAAEFATRARDLPDGIDWQQWFESCDARRFTGQPPTSDDVQTAITTAERLIRSREASTTA